MTEEFPTNEPKTEEELVNEAVDQFLYGEALDALAPLGLMAQGLKAGGVLEAEVEAIMPRLADAHREDIERLVELSEDGLDEDIKEEVRGLMKGLFQAGKNYEKE